MDLLSSITQSLNQALSPSLLIVADLVLLLNNLSISIVKTVLKQLGRFVAWAGSGTQAVTGQAAGG